jgi:hypothetical protein
MAARFAGSGKNLEPQMHTDKRIAAYKAEKISPQAQEALNRSDFEHE